MNTVSWLRASGPRWPSLLGALLLAACGDARNLESASESDRDGGHSASSAPSPASTPAARGTGDAGGSSVGGSDRSGSPAGVSSEPADPAAYIYDDAALRTYELRLDPADLARIDANPRAEEYVPGELVFEGETYGPVGIRYKGSVGAFRGCTTGARSGAKTCTKLSMKVSFNWDDPEGRFYGLKKLQFHAMNRDPSMLKDRLGYALFRQFGVVAPRSVHARLLINGELAGLFALVEQVDGRFTRSRFEEGGKGNLYKEAWPVGASGAVVSEEVLRESLRTNEDEDPTFEGMLGLGAALEQADEDGLVDALSDYTDLKYSMRYVAVDRAIAHDDGPFHWYCFGASCFNHNYYLYEEADREQLWLIAWDLDSSFNLDNTTTTVWFDWDDTSLGCEAQTQPPFQYPQRPSACDPMTRGWAYMQSRYLDETRAFLEGPFEASKVEAQLSRWQAQIEPFVEEAAGEHADAVSVSDWEQATAALREAIRILRSRAEDRVARGPAEIRDPWLPPMEMEMQMEADAGVADAGAPIEAGVMDAGMDSTMPDPMKDAAPPAPDADVPDDGDDDAGVD